MHLRILARARRRWKEGPHRPDMVQPPLLVEGAVLLRLDELLQPLGLMLPPSVLPALLRWFPHGIAFPEQQSRPFLLVVLVLHRAEQGFGIRLIERSFLPQGLPQ